MDEFNLQTFPKLRGYVNKYYKIDELREWKEGFKKSEEEKNREAEGKMANAWHLDERYDMHYWKGYLKRGKEILGVDSLQKKEV